MKYQQWYKRILAVGLMSLIAIMLSTGLGKTEENTVVSTTDSNIVGAFTVTTYPMQNDSPYPGRRDSNCCSMSTDGSFLFVSDDRRLVDETTLSQQRMYLYDADLNKMVLLPKFDEDEHAYGHLSPDKTWAIIGTKLTGTGYFKQYFYDFSTKAFTQLLYWDGTLSSTELSKPLAAIF